MLASYDLSTFQWVLFLLCGMLIGMSKTGVPGTSMIVVPLLAMIFGGKPSTGVLLPILVIADAFGVYNYSRHANWKYLLKALPWAFAGIFIALWVGNQVNDVQFKTIMAIIIFAGVALMLWRDRSKNKETIPTHWSFAASLGLLGGFATMMGNAAGSIMAIYLLALRLPKNEYIGTAAWFFFIVNIFKLPLHIFSWKTITVHSVLLDLVTFPAIALGAFLGIQIIKKIPNTSYRYFVIAITVASAFLMLF